MGSRLFVVETRKFIPPITEFITNAFHRTAANPKLKGRHKRKIQTEIVAAFHDFVHLDENDINDQKLRLRPMKRDYRRSYVGFCSDPMARWSQPDSSKYLENFPILAKTFGGNAFANSTAYFADAYAGAALWLPPGITPNEEALIGLVERRRRMR
jgi:hypothetical protein